MLPVWHCRCAVTQVVQLCRARFTLPPEDKSALRPIYGGAGRNRTDDLLLAKQALSQLSYGPDQKPEARMQSRWDGLPSEARRAKDGGPGKT